MRRNGPVPRRAVGAAATLAGVTDRPTDSDAAKAFVGGVFDRAAATYDQTGIEFFGTVGRTLVRRSDPQPGERVLDLGCGLGASALPTAERVGPSGHVLGLDLAPGMVEGLRARASAAGLANLECRVGDAEAPDVEPGAWDLVQASLVLFFLPDLRAALEAYRRLLRPGGRLAFSWFGRDDARWDPIYSALVADLPREQAGTKRPGSDGPFSGVAALDAFLVDAGYTDVHTHLETVTVLYPDEESWWRTMWSHGRRATLERLEAEGLLESTMSRMTPVFDPVRRPDGSLEWVVEMAYTTARP